MAFSVFVTSVYIAVHSIFNISVLVTITSVFCIVMSGICEIIIFSLVHLLCVNSCFHTHAVEHILELDTLIDELKACLTQKPENFQRAMKKFQELEVC